MFGNSPLITTGLKSTLTLPKVLNGISKTLGIVNQAIPLYRQAKPMIQKGRTLFKLASELGKPDSTTSASTTNKQSIKSDTTLPLSTPKKLNTPTFFQ